MLILRLMTVFALALIPAACGMSSRPPSRPDITSMNVRILMVTTAGDITLELDPVRAPVTVANFLDHTRQGHYDGTIFHRVVPDFVVQGGGWTPDLKERAKSDAANGRPDLPIKNEWRSGLTNDRGTIAMARDEQPDTATREFYFNLKDNTKLDTARPTTGNAGYAVFGRVVSGWEVVEKIAAGKTSPREIEGVTDGSMKNVPDEPVKIVVVKQIASTALPAAHRRAGRELPPHER